MMGGVTVDLEGRTTLAGLWAAGEVTSSGLHGANRLASNSLSEAMVYGAEAGEGASRAAAAMPDTFHALTVDNQPVEPSTEPLNLADIRNSLKSLMWRDVGVRRDAEGLADATESINHWCRYVLPRQFSDPGGWELQNMLLLARLMIQSALERRKAAAHTSAPTSPTSTTEHWNRHISFRM